MIDRVWLVGRYLTEAEWAAAQDADERVANWAVEMIASTEERARRAALEATFLQGGDPGWFMASLPVDTPFAPGRVETFPDFEWVIEL